MPVTRVRIIIQYDGTDYVGWQTQPNGVSVQEIMERELSRLTGERIVLFASGRTDSGVHARAQVAHFDTQSRIPADKYCYALNVSLPRDIRVCYSDAAPEGFHARFSVQEKRYRYTILTAPHDCPFTSKTALHVHMKLDEEAMRRAAEKVIGTHDFLGFKAAGTKIENTVRTLYRSGWTRSGDLLYYDVAGSGFMYNMVRILAGTMLDIGMGRLDESAMTKALESRDRSMAGATAPAHGLMLMGVRYDDFDTEDHICSIYS